MRYNHTRASALNDRPCKEDTTVQKGTERNTNVAREPVRAVEGERMWVLLNYVKADKWEQHEHFVHDIFVPAIEKVEPSVLRRTRVLHPAEQNEDGTYTSVFLMDPLAEGADYDILSLLTKAYGEDKAEEYIQLWGESLASPRVGYALIQSPW
jgi:hypothetical protein